jgi:hypothetical protein
MSAMPKQNFSYYGNSYWSSNKDVINMLFAKECRFIGKKMIALTGTDIGDDEVIITAENI